MPPRRWCRGRRSTRGRTSLLCDAARSCLLLPSDAERGETREQGAGMALRGRCDEDGVVACERAEDLAEPRRIECRAERVRGAGGRAQHDHVRRDRGLHRVVLAEAAQPIRAAALAHGGRRRVDVRAVTGDLHETQLDDVARHRGLRRRKAGCLERADQLLLGREVLLPYETHQRLLPVMLARESFPHAAASKTVPTCSPVSSFSIASAPRAATIAARQPALAANRLASTFGTMPPSIVPSSTSVFAWAVSREAMTFPSFERTPGTSVTNTSSRAPRLAASAPAAPSPFTLRISPSFLSSAAGATTGTRPASRSSSSKPLSTSVTRPTRPSSASSRSARSIPPSRPDSPTAGTPRAMSAATTRLFARPASVASATSRVGASVTRSPRTNRVSRPRRPDHSVASGPPPWTTTSECPESWSAPTTSSAPASTPKTAPPIFNTTTSLTSCTRR